jgi:hypothetical protein
LAWGRNFIALLDSDAEGINRKSRYEELYDDDGKLSRAKMPAILSGRETITEDLIDELEKIPAT